MSRPTHLPPPANPALAPVLGAVVYVAALVAAWGGLSLLLDRDVVDYRDAGPLLGPSMALVAIIVTWLVTWWVVRKGHPLRGALIAAVVSYLGMLVVPVIGYTVASAAHFAISPFIVTAALLSPCIVVSTWALVGRSASR